MAKTVGAKTRSKKERILATLTEMDLRIRKDIVRLKRDLLKVRMLKRQIKGAL